MNKLSNMLRYVLDFIYPHICLICDDKINLDIENQSNNNHINNTNNEQILNTYTDYKNTTDRFVCLECKKQVEFAPSPTAIMTSLNDLFLNDSLAISNAVSFFYNSENIPVINLVYHLKYQGLYVVGYEYGKWLGRLLKEENMTNYDYVIPVPLHNRKKKERGYNQADYIVKGICEVIQKPMRTDLLQRTRYTTSQTQLASNERLHNLTDAFQPLNRNEIIGKNILLVDDVLTTGATLNNCAITLLEAAASKVDVATIIKA